MTEEFKRPYQWVSQHILTVDMIFQKQLEHYKNTGCIVISYEVDIYEYHDLLKEINGQSPSSRYDYSCSTDIYNNSLNLYGPLGTTFIYHARQKQTESI